MSDEPTTVAIEVHNAEMMLRDNQIADLTGTLGLTRAGLTDDDGIATARMFHKRLSVEEGAEKPSIGDWWKSLNAENAPAPLRSYLQAAAGGGGGDKKAPAGGGLGGAAGTGGGGNAQHTDMNTRLAELNAKARDGGMTSDLEAEIRSVLKAGRRR